MPNQTATFSFETANLATNVRHAGKSWRRPRKQMSDFAANAKQRFIFAKPIVSYLRLSRTIDVSHFGVGEVCCWGISILPNDDDQSDSSSIV